ncbi:hypothetical protein ACLQ2R_14650 [Streptosporangium sp. DT93]|uniref:hypothetical protein n=1 Tax=Streptosporangium sp. DT93 TaxID=3393428 RepID=UPI003CF7E6A5
MNSGLVDVAAVDANHAWAVGHQGSTYGGTTPERPYALLSWDGTGWTEQTLPDRPWNLEAVSASSEDDVWVLGKAEGYFSYAARWDGNAWRTFVPFPDDQYVGLNDVAATGRDHAWMVGASTGRPFIAEWDGREFKAVFTGTNTGPGSARLMAVTAEGRSEAWAVGRADDKPLIMRWDGASWRETPTPSVPGGELWGVHRVSANDVWAVGSTGRESLTPKPLLLHWNGVRWRSVTSPISTGALYGITGDASGRLWVSSHDNRGNATFLRYVNGRWTTVPASGTFEHSPYIRNLVSVPGTTTTWAVGNMTHPGGWPYEYVIARHGSLG